MRKSVWVPREPRPSLEFPCLYCLYLLLPSAICPLPPPRTPSWWLSPACTFDGGVDEDDSAHGRRGSDSAGGPIQQPLLLSQQVSRCGAGIAAQMASGREGAQRARA